MSTLITSHYQPQIAAAKRILSQQFGTTITIDHVENLTPDRERSQTWRLHIDSTQADIPTRVVLKHSVSDGASPYDPTGSPIHRLINDYAGCRFLSKISNDPPLAPKPYGFDSNTAIMLIEDIPNDNQSLVQPLLDGDLTTAESALTQLMTQLGQLHAKTIGKADQYTDIRDEIEHRPASNRRMMAEMYRSLGFAKLREAFHAIDYNPPDDVWAEFEHVVGAIENPRPFFAYVHGDPCPDNLLFSNGQLRLIDFELGGFGHCLLDAVYPRIMFPSCWCANMIPTEVVERLESRYRAELSHTCPEADDDDTFRRGLADACGLWLINTLILKLFWSNKAYDEDIDWGLSSHHRRIISRLIRFAETAEQEDVYPVLQNLCHDLLDLLGERWEHAAEGLPTYPSFAETV